MNNNINYINNFPDFITMQRNSFCWFITEGLTQELSFFSRIYDFTKNTEYILFGEEYNLINPPCSSKIARKYNGNYRAQLILPLEVRNKIINDINYRNKFPIVTLPLMTTYATFILNGCERVIVSQIIRSPGIYFGKVTNQTNFKPFKSKSITKINKLRSFLPSGEAIISENDLFFPISTRKYNKKNKKLKIIPLWNSNSVRLYSLNYLKKKLKNNPFQLLQFFKVYKIVLLEGELKKKKKLISLFFQWLKNNYNLRDSKSDLKKATILFLMEFFKIFLKSIIKYKLIITNSDKFNYLTRWDKIIKFSKYFENLTMTDALISFYFQNIFRFQLYSQLECNKQLIFILNYKFLSYRKYNLETFPFLKKQINKLSIQINSTFEFTGSKNLKPIIYSSKNLKNTLKYDPFSINPSSKHDKYILYSPAKHDKQHKHKYLKTKTSLLLFRDEYDLKTSAHLKYNEKDIYNALLIPEYGSWIRFMFQKNTQINLYKYPLKYQEETIYIQLDKTNQKPIIHLLKEIGFDDLEIYNNLDHSDFFILLNPYY